MAAQKTQKKIFWRKFSTFLCPDFAGLKFTFETFFHALPPHELNIISKLF